MQLYYDNKSVMSIAHKQVQLHRTKHILKLVDTSSMIISTEVFSLLLDITANVMDLAHTFCLIYHCISITLCGQYTQGIYPILFSFILIWYIKLG